MYAPVCSGKGLVRLRIDRFKPFVAHRARVSCRNHERQVGEGFARSRTTDGTMRNKYDQAQAQDMPIVERVLEVAEHHGVPMAQVALAWHWAKGVTAPIVGCLQPERVDDAIAALGVQHHVYFVKLRWTCSALNLNTVGVQLEHRRRLVPCFVVCLVYFMRECLFR